MELDEKIRLKIDVAIRYNNILRLDGIFTGLIKEEMIMDDMEWVIDETKEIGLKSDPYLKYYFNEIAKLTI